MPTRERLGEGRKPSLIDADELASLQQVGTDREAWSTLEDARNSPQALGMRSH